MIKKHSHTLTLAALTLLTSSAVKANELGTHVVPESSAINPTIVGGVNATKGEFPWIASIQLNGRHDCGGSLVADGWLLTAAHCTRGRYTTSNIKVLLGLHQQNNKGEATEYSVTQIISHPNYNGNNGLHNDVALLKLSGDTSSFPKVTMADTNFMDSWGQPGATSTVAGWGATRQGGSGANTLQKVDVPIVSNADCNLSYPGDIANDNICAGFQEGGRDSCQGDSGGPMIVTRPGEQVQVGIVSWGEGCALPNRYGVYARMSYLKSWVESNLDDAPPGGGDVTELQNGVAKTGLSGSTSQESHYKINVPANASSLSVNISSGSGDADLYVRFGDKATTGEFECRPYRWGNNETCTINNPRTGDYFIMLNGYSSYSGVRLVASY